MNSFHVVGQYHRAPEKLENSTSKVHAEFWVKSKPNFLRVETMDEMDIFPIVSWKGMSAQIHDSLKEGDLVCVRGRMEPHDGGIRLIAELIESLSDLNVNF